MSIQATVSKKQLMRLSFLTLFTTVFTIWFLYDGLVGWPAQRARWQEPWDAFQEIQEEYKDSVGGREAWTDIVVEKVEAGEWDVAELLEDAGGGRMLAKNPVEPKSEADITGQYFWAALPAPFAVYFLITLLRTLGRTMEADEEGITASWGPRVEYAAITKIDKKRWDKKGICRLHYQAEGGEKTFIVDDYIFERPPTDEIMRLIEQKAGVDKIVNGKPEPPPKAEVQETGDGGQGTEETGDA